jgi:hypothetical protein
MLYDLYDASNEGSDGLTLGLAPLWQVLTSSAYRNTPAMISIFPFISELKAARPADVAAINALVSAQNINAAAIDIWGSNETNMPYVNNMLPMYTPITPGTPVVVRSIDDGGMYNKAGNHRFLRFTAATSGSVSVTVTTSNATVPDPDFRVFRAGVPVMSATGPPAQFETSQPFNVTASQTYVIDAYECSNGCSEPQGTPGDYELTVTIN